MSEIGGSASIARPAFLAAVLLAVAACSAGSSDASTLLSDSTTVPAGGIGPTDATDAAATAVDGVEIGGDAAAPADTAASTVETATTARQSPDRARPDRDDDPADDAVDAPDDTDPVTVDDTASTTTGAPAPTSTTEPPIDAADPDCVVRATADTSLESAVRGLTTDLDTPDGDLDIVGLWVENRFADTVRPGDLIDVCVGNGVDDVDGGDLDVTDAEIDAARSATIERQQTRLNELFADLGTGDIAVDGQSGDRTGQRLCGARLMLGLTPSMADMLPGTIEQATLFATEALPTPFDHDADDERWILIDRTCQLLFAGTGSNTVYAFPTSTGEEGFETRLQDRARAIRFNPAVENGGWHDSSEFPVGVDNPLNGNMYKPLYFDLGQAIHGATHVPPVPDSKGCARLRVGDHDRLLAWVGLADAQEETWRRDDLTIEVSVQGDFIDR
ncbi:MAG: L,D-transpeptidase [Actinomycetota bacterium]